MLECFISYKVKADDNVALQLSRFLQDNDFKVFVDKKSLLPGQNWVDELQHSVTQSDYVFAIFTQDYIARVVEGNCNGDNFIIEELNWALKDNKLIPIGIGVTVEEIKTCFDLVPSLKPIQFQMFPTDLSEQCFHIILNKLYKRIYSKDSKAKSILPVSHSVNVSGTALSSEDAYLKLDMPWNDSDAIEYKNTLKRKVLKSAMDYVVLAKFHIKGRFGLKISTEIAYHHFENEARNNCREAFFELGQIYEADDNQYGCDEDKATEYYTKAHELGDMRATYHLGLLFDDNIENKNCPTQFLKEKYGIEHSNKFVTEISQKIKYYNELTTAEKYVFCLTQISVNKNTEQAIKQIEKLAVLGYLPAIYWLACKHFDYDIEDYQTINSIPALDIRESLNYLQAGEEQGCCRSRKRLANWHLFFEGTKGGFTANHEFGIRKHQENIALNYFDSAYDLIRLLSKYDYYRTLKFNPSHFSIDEGHLSIEEQISMLECGAAFGNAKCRRKLVTLYSKSNNPDMIPLMIEDIGKGDLSIIDEYIDNNIYSFHFDEADYQKFYALLFMYYKDLPEKSFKKSLMDVPFMMFSLFHNKLDDALRIIKVDAVVDYAYVVSIILNDKHIDAREELSFQILKYGAKNGCEKSNDWLLMIVLNVGDVKPMCRPQFLNENLNDVFWREFLQSNLNKNREVKGQYTFTNETGESDSCTLSSSFIKSILELYTFAIKCEESLLTLDPNSRELLDLYRELTVGKFANFTSGPLPFNKEYKDLYNLKTAFINKLFRDVKNMDDMTAMSALCIHLTSTIKRHKDLELSQKLFQWCLLRLKLFIEKTSFYHSSSTTGRPSRKLYVPHGITFKEDFTYAYEAFFSDGVQKAMINYDSITIDDKKQFQYDENQRFDFDEVAFDFYRQQLCILSDKLELYQSNYAHSINQARLNDYLNDLDNIYEDDSYWLDL
ncbi:toll/interleukin-1 receptor domain-containing protein [Colwellia psychrerythraea]|uniref:TIR domain-containing protein n=1 Tax=Colwellia psychrerythraea (strain 34H / ATCC BAA-681) TaxID=167879 RepID=Q484I8_COLP3|nr:TIR domain-containing protein [Colwellia psychrerythraea]AAZ24925.1 hypothetical protein CPS_1796 [Colwellia psychrerythraea 34H]